MLLAAAPVTACGRYDVHVVRPPELVGRWATDSLWTDTVELLADGRTLGWHGRSERDSVRWSVVQTRAGAALCVGAPRQAVCERFRFAGDTLIVGRLPKESYYRRAH